mgnify:CR=1 FL=1
MFVLTNPNNKHFKKLENIYNFHLVDADKSEVSYLKKNFNALFLQLLRYIILLTLI